MPIDILMPALSPTMESGNLAKWHVKEGDTVVPGDVIAEIETDKATMEVEAVDEGRIGRILIAEGSADVPVNQVIAVLLAEGEDAAAAAVAAPVETLAAPSAPGSAQPSAPRSAPPPAPPSRANGGGDRVIASPLARRIAAESGIDLAAIPGSGPRGRIVKRDVDAAISGGTVRPAPRPKAPAKAPAPRPAAPAPVEVEGLYETGTFDVVPHDTIRKVIARRLTESKQTIPHFYLSVDCALDNLLALRRQINDGAPADADGKPAFKVSVNDFVIKAMAMALRDVPDANVTWTEEAMLKHHAVDVGVAVAIPGGLITPVVRGAEQKTLSAISEEMKDFAARARARKLLPEEYQGGATTISNLGMYGIPTFSAVINPPHATILAVGAGEKRAIVRDDGSLGTATMMSVTLSTDHRAVDGALGAELLGAFKRYIENPAAMLV